MNHKHFQTVTHKSHSLRTSHHLSPSAYTIKRAGANAKHSGAAKPTRRRRDDRAVYSSRRKRSCIASRPAFTLKQIHAPTRVVKSTSPLGRSRGETTKKILGTRLCTSLRVLHISRFSYLRHYGARLPDVKAAYARIRKTCGGGRLRKSTSLTNFKEKGNSKWKIGRLRKSIALTPQINNPKPEQSEAKLKLSILSIIQFHNLKLHLLKEKKSRFRDSKKRKEKKNYESGYPQS